MKIKTNKQYIEALKRFEKLFSAEDGTPESKEANKLSVSIKDYEDKHFIVGASSKKEKYIYCKVLEKNDKTSHSSTADCMLEPEYPKKFKSLDSTYFETRIFSDSFLSNLNSGDYFIIKITEEPGRISLEIFEDKEKLKWFKTFMKDVNSEFKKEMKNLSKSKIFTKISKK